MGHSAGKGANFYGPVVKAFLFEGVMPPLGGWISQEHLHAMTDRGGWAVY
jgi:hypothetical protein